MLFRRIILLCLLVSGLLPLTGCFFLPQKPYASLGEEPWPSELNGDLRTAVSHLVSEELKVSGQPNVQVLWVGVRSPGEYTVERGPTGLPLDKYAQLRFVFKLADGKCYVDNDFSTLTSWPLLVRTNEGGSRYGEPRVRGFHPVAGFGNNYPHLIACDAAAHAKGGVLVDDTAGKSDAVAGASSASSASADSSSSAPTPDPAKGSGDYNPKETLAKLAPTIPAACQEYARVTCTNPNLPAGTDRKHFCENLVQRTNTAGQKRNAGKSCKAMLKASSARP